MRCSEVLVVVVIEKVESTSVSANGYTGKLYEALQGSRERTRTAGRDGWWRRLLSFLEKGNEK